MPGRLHRNPQVRRESGLRQRRSNKSWRVTHHSTRPRVRAAIPAAKSGTGLRFETGEHGGDHPDNMPQAITVTDAQGRWAVYVPLRVGPHQQARWLMPKSGVDGGAFRYMAGVRRNVARGARQCSCASNLMMRPALEGRELSYDARVLWQRSREQSRSCEKPITRPRPARVKLSWSTAGSHRFRCGRQAGSPSAQRQVHAPAV